MVYLTEMTLHDTDWYDKNDRESILINSNVQINEIASFKHTGIKILHGLVLIVVLTLQIVLFKFVAILYLF